MADPKATAAEDVTLVGLPPLADVHENSLNDGEEQSTRSVLTTRTTPSVISEESASRRGTGYNADIEARAPRSRRRTGAAALPRHLDDRNAMAAVLQGMVRGKNTRRVGGRHGSLIAAAHGLTRARGGRRRGADRRRRGRARRGGRPRGPFEASSAGHLVEETNHKERRAYEAISADAKLAPWAPKYDGFIKCFDKEDPTQVDAHHVKLRLQDVTRAARAVRDGPGSARGRSPSRRSPTRAAEDPSRRCSGSTTAACWTGARRRLEAAVRARPPRGACPVRTPQRLTRRPSHPSAYNRARVEHRRLQRHRGHRDGGRRQAPEHEADARTADLLAALRWFCAPTRRCRRGRLHATFLAKLRALRVDLAASGWFARRSSSSISRVDAAPSTRTTSARRGSTAPPPPRHCRSAAVYMIDFAGAASEGALARTSRG